MDLDRIKRNVAKMAAQNAPVEDIDGYISSEGATVDQIRAHKPAAQPSAPSMSAGETVADVAKSAGIGVAQGAIGLATLPGNLEYLGRAGIDAAARGLGFEDPEFSSSTALPTYSDAKGAIERRTGEFYKPRSTAGEYARTIGEFAPLAALGPAGAFARTANVVAPAVVSETAGQLTEGTAAEPWARAAGALAGGQLPNAAMRVVSPNPVSSIRSAHVQRLENEGVTSLTAGQKTGAAPLQWAESAAKDIPFNGGRAKALVDQQAEQFTAAVLRRAGINNANRATPEVIDYGFRSLGQQFDTITARNSLKVDAKLRDDVTRAVREYDELVPPTQRAPVVGKIVSDIRGVATPGEGIAGDVYQAVRSRLESMRRSSASDPQLSYTLGRLREALDEGMERSVKSVDAGRFRQVRGQYRNLLSIEKAVAGAGENAAMGLISPAQLRNAVRTQNRRAYVRGQDDLGNLARSGEAVMKPLPQSGTAPRALASGMLGAGGYAGLTGDIATGMMAAVTPAITSRVLMTPVMQNYLANQAAAPAIREYTNALLRPRARIPQALQEFEAYQER